MPKKLQKLIAIVGPTASGKTDLAFALAKKFNGYIICADSRTIYKEMNIGTAKPYGARPPLLYKCLSRACRGKRAGGRYAYYRIKKILHYGLDLINPPEQFNVAEFKEYVDRVISAHSSRHPEEESQRRRRISFTKILRLKPQYDVPLLVGGTGLYISAVVDNLSFPDAPPDQSFRITQELCPLSELVAELLEKDPLAQNIVDLTNKRRVIRALEVIHKTHIPFTIQYTKDTPRYDVLILGVKRDRGELYTRINQRVDDMMRNGFLEEFEILYKKYGCHIPGMSGIGYHQFCLWKQGVLSLEQAIEKFKQGDRNLAKRQLTWFNRDTRIHWVESLHTAEQLIHQWL